jgi:hypothetical protein
MIEAAFFFYSKQEGWKPLLCFIAKKKIEAAFSVPRMLTSSMGWCWA